MQSIAFMAGSIVAKASAAVAQIYVIYIATRLLVPNESAIIFLLIGYSIWFQVFEFGFSQTLQNSLNSKVVSLSKIIGVLLIHYLVLCVFGVVFFRSELLADLLLPTIVTDFERVKLAFMVGSTLLLIGSVNPVTIRIMLVLDYGRLVNLVQFLQSTLVIIGLSFIKIGGGATLLASVLLIFGPSVVIYFFVMVFLVIKAFNSTAVSLNDGIRSRWGDFIRMAIGYAGINILTVTYLGLDYFFVAHFLEGEDVVGYHVVTRLFFIPFVLYYAYLQHATRHLDGSKFVDDADFSRLMEIGKPPLMLGVGGVILMTFTLVSLGGLGLLGGLTNGVLVSLKLILAASVYYLIRVLRDVFAVMMLVLDIRPALYIMYGVELIAGVAFMSWLVPIYQGEGVFLSFAGATGISILMVWHLLTSNKIKLKRQ